MILSARMKHNADLATSIGWHGEAFARTKRLQPLAKLLEVERDPQTKRADGAARVASLFRKIHSKQKGSANGSG